MAFGKHGLCGHIRQAIAGFDNQQAQPVYVERRQTAVPCLDVHRRNGSDLHKFSRRCAFARALFAIKDVSSRNFVVFAAHQRKLDLILDLFDMERAALSAAARQRRNDLLSQFLDGLVNAPRCSRAPPSTARNALVSATVILLASNSVTPPLRRMTWNSCSVEAFGAPMPET